MAVFVDSANFRNTPFARKGPCGFHQGSSRSVTVGLVNNMPDEAAAAPKQRHA